jgi:hypothetical protein
LTFNAIWVVVAAMSVLGITGLVIYPGPSWIYPALMGMWMTFIALLMLHDHYADKKVE